MTFATERFAARGYHPTSVAEIVDGIGVGKGVFYWYFESKDALLTAILQEAQRDLRRAQQDAIEGVDDPLRRIELGIRASVHWYAANRAVDQVSSFARSEARFADVLRQGTEVAVQDTMRHLREAVARGTVRDGDLELQANAILGVTRHLARRFLRDAARPIDAVADEAVAFCLGGLDGPRAGMAIVADRDRGTVA